jgi:DNA-binding transcriptional MerR regulator
VSIVDLFDDDLPQIPDRVYFTIGEASRLCGVKPHVLRYWEQEFEQLKPDKRRGNRRYYRYQDLIMIRLSVHWCISKDLPCQELSIALLKKMRLASKPLKMIQKGWRFVK